MKKIFLILSIGLLSSCASYVIKTPDGRIVSQGSATGFLRTITVVERYENDKCVERKISTDSTTGEILMGFDKLLDTTVNTAAKLKP